MSKIDLLPCPFCGKLETIRMLYIPAEKRKCVYHVVCDALNGGCGASTGLNHETPEKAAEEWNTRASSWSPCGEMMPEDNTEVIVYDDCFLIATTLNPLPEIPQRKDDTHDND